MRVLDRASGQYFEFPDNATDQDIINTFQGARQQQQGNGSAFAPLAQQFMQGMQQQPMMQPPQQSTLPNIGGGSVVGLNPQQAQFVLGQAQQSNVDAMTQRLRQQQMTQQGIESEKDRSMQLKLQSERLKNEEMQNKIRLKQEKMIAERQAKLTEKGQAQSQSNADREYALRAQELQAGTQYKQDALDVQKQGLQQDILSGNRDYELRKQQVENQGWETRTMAYEGKNVIAAFKPGKAPLIMGDAAMDNSVKPITKADKVYQDNIMEAAKQISDAEGLSFYEAHTLAKAAISRDMGLKAFDNDSERMQFVQFRAQQLRDKAVSALPEAAAKNPDVITGIEDRSLVDAEIESYQANGLVSWQDPDTGEVKWYDPKEANDSE